MATADKLITVAENVPKVYHAGQLNVVENAECLKGTKTGTAMLLDDVSPVEHTMTVKVSSDTVEDLTAVKVSKYGKNLFDYVNVIFKANLPSVITTKDNNGFIFTAPSSSAYFNTSNISAFCLKPNTTYTSRATVTLIDNGSSSIGESGSMGLSLILQTNSTYDSSGKGKVYIVNGYQNNNGVFNKVGTHEIITTFTTPSDMTDFKYIVTRVSNNTTVIFKDIQIALGNTATDYEPYITPTDYIPTADGTVNGVTSLYPNTTLMTDTDGVIIDCKYYKDIDKAFNELSSAIALSGGE